ncbi:class A sortase [Enterococcus faecalis]|uniref:class A sortase n=1 Tax=Enterococcus faecalis TaxID=1351 RepID=UPI00288E9C59|nr:class A sortase [Enterococcus faecalis]EHU8854487.1 class A sortase [Enterococcus faecalis]MDT2054631.1 class A sortase [Enterococcus faecalis]MDV7826947.1 class A sortase [Enterococcus faecalis]MDV7840071.1 class A sortase [Enterococcus faecalis]
MKKWIEKNKYFVGAIGVILIALFSFLLFENQQKEEVKEAINTVVSSGLEEAEKQKKHVETKSSETVQSNQVDVITGTEAQEETPIPTVISLTEGERPSVKTIQNAQENFNEVSDSVLGSIEIDSIQLKLPILMGDSFDNMLYGACTVLSKQTMGKGNYALASHNAGYEGLLFTSLNKVSVGDLVKLNDREGHSFIYKVKEQKHVDMTDTTMLNLTRKPTLTLITCDQATKTTGRIIVIAELV